MVRGGHLWREQDSAAAVWCGAALPRGALGALSGARARCAAGHTVAHTPALPWATAMVVRATGALRAVRVQRPARPARRPPLARRADCAPLSLLPAAATGPAHVVFAGARHCRARWRAGRPGTGMHRLTHTHTHTHTHACHMQRLSAYACTGVCLFM